MDLPDEFEITRGNDQPIRLAQQCGDEGLTRINTLLNFSKNLGGRQLLFDLASQSGGICLDPNGNVLNARPTAFLEPDDTLDTHLPEFIER